MISTTSISRSVLAFIGAAVLGCSVPQAQSAQASKVKANAVKPVKATPKPVKPAESDAIAFSRQMGIGWNLGNTLDAIGDPNNATTVKSYETAWGNPVTTKAMIDGIKASGFKSIRIPVAWSNMMAPDYTIDPRLMARVEEVAKYGLDNGMYVMINIHWDGGWIHKFSTDYDGTMKKYQAVWTQISNHFKGYSDHLIFESMNEEGAFDDLWNPGRNLNQKDKAYETLNNINQAFTDLVRASGGNNGRRYLLIAGYATDIRRTVDTAFQMPRDPLHHSMVSVHYYSPPTFAILEKDADWGKAAYSWGTPAEVATVRTDMLPMKKRFIDQGIPVVLGEFGSPTVNKDKASIVKYVSTVAQTAQSLGFVPVLWDAGGFYSRRTLRWDNPQIGQALAKIATNQQPKSK